MKITILSGSIRKGRQSHKVAVFLKNKLEERAVQTDLIDLSEMPVPLFGDEGEHAASLAGNVEAIRDKLQNADALLFVGPEYHGSFSGVLKNALDYFWSEFQKKPVGVATVSTGQMGGINASTQLQHVILSLGAYPLPLKLIVPAVQNTFDDSASPLHEGFTKVANKFLHEFLWFATAIKDQKEKDKSNPKVVEHLK